MFDAEHSLNFFKPLDFNFDFFCQHNSLLTKIYSPLSVD